MHRVILIHANCMSRNALGDFVFAGNLAKEIKIGLGTQDIDVFLVSTQDGLSKYQRLYGMPHDGRVLIEGVEIGISSLEDFDAVNHQVIAYIDANRCKHPSSMLLKRVLDPDTRFIFIGNMNQISMSDGWTQQCYLRQLKHEQPGIYEAFDEHDLLFGATGFGKDRFGIPHIYPSTELPPLTETATPALISKPYGFMYLAAQNPSQDYASIAQYMQLTKIDNYVLVGNFAGAQYAIQSAMITPASINFFETLDNSVMRRMVANASTSLVISTGVTSTLEAMRDRKLCYYQNMMINRHFISAYLSELRSLISISLPIADALAEQIIELSLLLFAPKPLSSMEMTRTSDLLDSTQVCEKMTDFNQSILDKASGKIAPRLLGFISIAHDEKNPKQLAYVLHSLRKPEDRDDPLHDQALRRAAAWGRLLELKRLIRDIAAVDLHKTDGTNGMTALHFAVKCKYFDCARELIRAGLDVNFPSKMGKTALHWAVTNEDKPMIKFLIEHGATRDVMDNNGVTPESLANEELRLFIHACYEGLETAPGVSPRT